MIDLDALDFDQPQVITPAPKTRLDLVEIAVPKESLSRLFSSRLIVVCEGKDHALYNASCDDASRLFIPPGSSDNAAGVLAMARANPGYRALRDRDFLMPSEIDIIKAELPNYRILPCYSIENLLYHPDNLASLDLTGFDPAAWKAAILAWKNVTPLLELKYERGRISELRAFPSLRNSHEAGPAKIREAHQSQDFEICYPVIPMQRMPQDFLARFNLSRDQLARAPWFRRTVREIVD